jgi:hypothetical protein
MRELLRKWSGTEDRPERTPGAEEQKAAKITSGLKLSFKTEIRLAWRSCYNAKTKSSFYRRYTRSGLHGDPGNDNSLRKVIAKANRYTLSRVVQLRTGRNALGSYKRVGVSERNQNCDNGQSKKVDHLLKDCVLCESGRSYLREPSQELDISALLDSKKRIEAVIKFFDTLPHLLN